MSNLTKLLLITIFLGLFFICAESLSFSFISINQVHAQGTAADTTGSGKAGASWTGQGKATEPSTGTVPVIISTKFDSTEAVTGNGGSYLMNYITIVYTWVAGLAGSLAVLMIIISGIQIIAAGADQSALDPAKQRLMGAVLGLVLLMASSLILITINPNFFN